MEDPSKIPLLALRKATVSLLSNGLNPLKVLPTEDGLPRDWRGLAHLAGLNGVETSRIASSNDPTALLINQWGPQATIETLFQYLALIDRFDVLDDSKSLIEADVEVYLNRSSHPSLPIANASDNASDVSILTVDDVARLEQGLEPQIYDAYLLFAEEDIDFASQIVDNMEQKYGLKLCVRDRDLVGGIAFEHDAIMKLIAERCRRLLVVVTPNFLKSPANKFFVTFAQALGIDQRQRKVIPILYQKCDLPPELSYYFLLDYNRAGTFWNFWDKLRDSIQTPDPVVNSTTTLSPWIRKPAPPVTTPIEQSKTSSAPEAVKNTPEPIKKPLLKNITSSLSNLVTNNNKEKKESKEMEGIDEKESQTLKKKLKKKLFGRKKVDPLLS